MPLGFEVSIHVFLALTKVLLYNYLLLLLLLVLLLLLLLLLLLHFVLLSCHENVRLPSGKPEQYLRGGQQAWMEEIL